MSSEKKGVAVKEAGAVQKHEVQEISIVVRGDGADVRGLFSTPLLRAVLDAAL